MYSGAGCEAVLWYFFFFKQKTAYEIGTGDWSSDVCSSDLAYLILYNKRRPFEVAELRRTTYIAEAYKSIKDNHEILASLTYAKRVMATR